MLSTQYGKIHLFSIRFQFPGVGEPPNSDDITEPRIELDSRMPHMQVSKLPFENSDGKGGIKRGGTQIGGKYYCRTDEH